jgi:mRNA-degrading endonuclease RelE of RelBE toxin-antitoxin system
MSFEILRTDAFTKHLKLLSKKYPSIKKDYASFIESLQTNPLQGESLGKSCYKVRLKITSKSAGKSGGARVITYVRLEKKRITLLDIYDKSVMENITDKQLILLIKKADFDV